MSLKMAVPNKGRLNERAVELLQKSGLEINAGQGRKLYATVENKDFEIMFLRAQDIPRFIHSGTVDLGITGLDQVMESEVKLERLLNLEFGHCRLSVAVPESASYNNVSEMPDGQRVATSFPKLTKKYFHSKNKKVEVVQVTGAAEVAPHIGVSDIIVDLVSSGSTLKTNRLREIETIMDSQAVIVANTNSFKLKKAEIYGLVSSIESVLLAEKKKYLMADIPTEKLKDIEKMFPGMAGPTVMSLAGRDDMVAIHVVIEKSQVYDAVNILKEMGAKGILTLPIDRLVP